MLDIDTLAMDDIATALADQTDYERHWLIHRRTGKIEFWTADVDGDLDDLDPDLLVIDPIPSRVWYHDMVDFAGRPFSASAADDLHRALDGRGAFRRFRNVLHDRYPALVPLWYEFNRVRGLRRAASWLHENDLVTASSADRYIAAHPDPSPPGFAGPPTEARNPATTEIDLLDTIDVLRLINAEDSLVPGAVGAALPALASAVDLAVARLRRGGRVHYAGAGTSGRVAALDAAEIPPTYGVPASLFVAHLAGGAAALTGAVENAEDDIAAGRAALSGVTADDVVMGMAASGGTPFVAGAFAAARAAGAATVLVSANPAAPLAEGCDVFVCADTGPEAIAGSTRMKAGTAQKMVLHTFSTAVMIRLGHTYSNLMVDMRATNAKLRSRTLAVLEEATGRDADACEAALAEADGSLKVAMTALLAGTGAPAARAALDASGGVVRAALERLAAS